MDAEYIMDTIAKACALAEILKAKGDHKGAKELLDRVAEIEDRLMYMTAIGGASRGKSRNGEAEAVATDVGRESVARGGGA